MISDPFDIRNEILFLPTRKLLRPTSAILWRMQWWPYLPTSMMHNARLPRMPEPSLGWMSWGSSTSR